MYHTIIIGVNKKHFKTQKEMAEYLGIRNSSKKAI